MGTFCRCDRCGKEEPCNLIKFVETSWKNKSDVNETPKKSYMELCTTCLGRFNVMMNRFAKNDAVLNDAIQDAKPLVTV